MKIKKIRIENIRRIKLAEIEPDGNVIYITGKNQQGKSSLLDALFSVFAGSQARAALQNGKTAGSVKVELDSEITLERKLTTKTATLTVTVSGQRVQSPQEFIEQRMRYFSFNPAEYFDADPKKRADLTRRVISGAVGDMPEVLEPYYKWGATSARGENILEKIDACINERDGILYVARRETGRMRDAYKVDEIAVEPEDIDELEQAALRARAIADEAKDARDRITQYANALTGISDSVGRIIAVFPPISEISDDSVKAMLEALPVISAGVARVKTILNGRENVANEAEKNYHHANNRWQIAQATQKQQAENAARLKKYRETVNEYYALNAAIDDLKKRRAEIAANCRLPVDGLAVEGANVTLNGIPFQDLSQSERMIISIRLAIALNPELRVMRLQNGNLLDGDTLAALEKLVTDSDYQLWIEYVTSDKSVGYYIEDGEIAK